MTERIVVTGAVQGVGFRPHVKALAERFHIRGEVCNSGGVVRISASCADGDTMAAFCAALRDEAPPGAMILSVSRTPVSVPVQGDGFAITESDADGDAALPVFVPDLATCPDCLSEMRDPSDRRYHYPLISCARCGPRYTILKTLPYDRVRTTMAPFALCPECAAEYERPGDRRRHAQTVSCLSCGPQITWTAAADAASAGGDAAMTRAVSVLKEGGVIGVKGVGGFLLLADPSAEEAVKRLRRMKGRETKPFAVLFPDLSALRAALPVSDKEAEALTAAARPILTIAGAPPSSWSREVTVNSAFVGVMLPANGVLQMLSDACGPLIATSANRSGEPMCLSEEAFFKTFAGADAADGVLTHDREILAPLDDSVGFAEAGEIRLVRRARGYVPLPVFIKKEAARGKDCVMAFGADLKAAFAIGRGDRIVLSQPFGDLTVPGVQRAFVKEIDRLCAILDCEPSRVVCDAHPGYESTRLAAAYAAEHALPPPERIYHHHAHVLAVMAERGLDSCVGIACDGTGYGPDGTVWGGEILHVTERGWQRADSLPPIRIPGGDAAARDAALSAAAVLYAAGEERDIPGFEGEKRALYMEALRRGEGILSTSAGRRFDAEACLLGICSENRYEGECAMALEAAAHRFLRGDTAGDQEKEIAAAYRAWLFHRNFAEKMAEQAMKAADRAGERDIVLAGGTMANRLLLLLFREILTGRGFRVHVSAEVPAGDGGIAVGQVFAALRGDPGGGGNFSVKK